jgi:hypothetical protein
MGDRASERRACRRTCVVLFVAYFSLGQDGATAGPLDFLRRVRDSIAHARHRHSNTRTTQTRSENSIPSQNTKPGTDRNQVRPPPLIEPPESPSPVAVATSVPAGQRSRTDFPYGIAVPNKPGFVTSPYSPQSGYVDVRGFPSGSEVKDPYTGKVFLTP